MGSTGNIVLIGYRASGKTTVGRVLAERLDRPFIDTDELIQNRLQRSIADIFRDEGEAFFRRIESEIIAELSAHQATVIAVGGGAVESEQNRRRLADLGVVVWLTAAVDELHRRILSDPQSAAFRPPLSSDDLLTEIQHTLARRAPLYRNLAQYAVDTTNLTPSDAAHIIRQWLCRSDPSWVS